VTVEIAWLAIGIIVAGFITGILAGLFGIGGGSIIVPVLFELFRFLEVPDAVRMQLCIGTSLAIIVPTTIRSYRTHKAQAFVVPDVMRRWMVPSVLGVIVGSILAAFAPPETFKGAFVIIISLIAIRLLGGGDRWMLGNDLPGPAAMTAYGFAIGLGSSLLGIAGGSLVTIVLKLYGKPIHESVGTAAGLGVPITLTGTVGYALAGLPHEALLPPLSIGFVSVIGFLLIAPLASWVAPIGARLAHRLPKRNLEIAFGVFLLIVAARFLVSLLFPGV
jgi:uncharacterized protein